MWRFWVRDEWDERDDSGDYPPRSGFRRCGCCCLYVVLIAAAIGGGLLWVAGYFR